MAEHQTEPPSKPPLRRHRLVPAHSDAVPPEGLPLAAVEQAVESWMAAADELSSPALAQGGLALADQAWRSIEKVTATLDSLSARLKDTAVPEEAFQLLELLSSMLLALPDQMASGLESSVVRVDWMFSRLLNAPAQPGVIDQVIEALELADASGEADAAPADYSAETAVLRGLHRDLVTLQQRWDELIEAIFPVAAAPFGPPLPGNGKAAPVGISVDVPASAPRPNAPAPLPPGLMVAQPASGGPPPRSFQERSASKYQQRLAMLLALAVLVIAVVGGVALEGRHAASNSPATALSVSQHTPAPTQTQPTPTPTPKPPTPTPKPPTPTPTPRPPTPTPNTGICPNGAMFCVSALQLQVPCIGQGSVSLQLIGKTANSESWQAFLTSGGSLVTISPSRGSLKQGQTVTLKIQANTHHQNRTGTISIFGPFGSTPINVAVRVCSN